jgi:hypothetical protein
MKVRREILIRVLKHLPGSKVGGLYRYFSAYINFFSQPNIITTIWLVAGWVGRYWSAKGTVTNHDDFIFPERSSW